MAELWPYLKIILAELAVIFKKFGRILFQTVGNTGTFQNTNQNKTSFSEIFQENGLFVENLMLELRISISMDSKKWPYTRKKATSTSPLTKTPFVFVFFPSLKVLKEAAFSSRRRVWRKNLLGFVRHSCV